MAISNYIVGNWKMNQCLKDIDLFIKDLSQLNNSNSKSWIAPQSIHIDYLIRNAQDSLGINIGAQNCSHQNSGAFTGDISPKSLSDLGASFVIIGHSERRHFFNETNEILNQKVITSLNNDLNVIFCVGETLEERELNNTNQIICKQLSEGLSNIDKDLKIKVIIAYEPVWAIGTGKSATPSQAQEVHQMIRNYSEDKLGFNSNTLPILYGGSVKPVNILELLMCEDINGALVGGASLKAADFIKLCKIANA
ncbi:MAG: triose-phosphate isomerase [Bdellovibrionales bacterium]|jgi:triosephosphate isomerase (TIM)|nr:triose-phosphate isomerase [Bdellovibrionales bacterium]